MVNEMPVWFASFITSKFDPFVESIFTKLNDLSVRLSVLEKSQAVLKDELSETRTKVNQIENTNSQIDSREICISGIPDSFSVDHEAAVTKIFEATDNSVNRNFVSKIRVFQPPARAASLNVPTSKSFSLVIRTVSPDVRNDIVFNARLLKGKTAQSIFGDGGERQVYMTAIWPRLVYDLLRTAEAKSKALNYLRPVVRNLVVHVRPNAITPSIPVHSVADLNKLLPVHK